MNNSTLSLIFNDSFLFSDTRNYLISKEELTCSKFVLESGDNEFFKYIYKGKVVGVKKIPKRKFQEFLKEVENLISAQHDNVIKLFGYVVEGSYCWLTLELAVCNLEEYIVEKVNYQIDPNDPNSKESFVIKVKELKMKLLDKKILNDVTNGVKHLHSKQIKHRDMKPENILIIDGVAPRAVVADFGHSKKLTNNLVSAVSGRKFGSDVSFSSHSKNKFLIFILQFFCSGLASFRICFRQRNNRQS